MDNLLREKIKDKLKEYKTKKSKMETSKETIKAWEEALSSEDIIASGIMTYSQPDDCWIKKFSKNSSGSGSISLVENEIIKGEEAKEYLKDLIRTEKSRVFSINLEVLQIEKALLCLTQEEDHIIKCKYFEKMGWTEIETSVNYSLRTNNNNVTASRLRQIEYKAINKLSDILKPYIYAYDI